MTGCASLRRVVVWVAWLCVVVVWCGRVDAAATTGTVKASTARKAARVRKPAQPEAINLGEDMFGKGPRPSSGSSRPLRRVLRGNAGRAAGSANTTGSAVVVPASMMQMLQQQQQQQKPRNGEQAQDSDSARPSSRRAIPGSGAYRDVDGKMRVYDDGTQVDLEGNVRVFQGRMLPPGIKLDRVRRHMQANSDATLEDAARAATEENE